MRKLSRFDMGSPALHGGANFAFANVDLPYVGSCSVPYLKANPTKKLLGDFLDLSTLGAALTTTLTLTKKSEIKNLSQYASFAGAALGFQLMKAAVEDYAVDPLYEYYGLE